MDKKVQLQFTLQDVSHMIACYIRDKKGISIYSNLIPFFNEQNELCFKFDHREEFDFVK